MWENKRPGYLDSKVDCVLLRYGANQRNFHCAVEIYICGFRLVVAQNDPGDFIIHKAFLVVEKLNQMMAKSIFLNWCQKAILAQGPFNMKLSKYLTHIFATIICSPNSTFEPS